MQLIRVLLIVSMMAPLVRAAEPTADELLQQARTAFGSGKTDLGLDLLGKAIAADPKNAQPYLIRAGVLESLAKNKEALADLNKVLQIEPKAADAYDRRGSVHFKLGQMKESLADFDKYLELKPNEFSGHWRRGITCYYAGSFDEGRKQFEGYEKVDTNDVENAVWHFLCVARASGVEKARAAPLKIGKDGRVPMMDVYALYAGKIKPEDVLTAAEAGNPPEQQRGPRLFYAHLYLGLYYEVIGEPKKAQEHMALAAEKYRIKHYMGDVAAVHLELMRKAK